MIGWQPSASKDVFGYIVYIYEEGIWKVMDTLHGAFVTFYADTLHADGSVHEYRIAAIDTCRNASPLGEIHHTLQLSASVKKCDSIVDLSWNSYAHMPGGTASFEVFAKSDSGVWRCVGKGGTETSFRCRGLDVLHSYTFYVRVWNPDRSVSASSSLTSVEFHRKVGHGKAYLRSVSVAEDDAMEITVFIPDTVDFRQLLLQRKQSADGPVVWTGTLPKGGDTYRWRQPGLDVTRHHYYVVMITDECDLPFYVSPAASNMVLALEEESEEENRITWTAYDGFGKTPDRYRVYRRTGSQSDFLMLAEQRPVLQRYGDVLSGLSSEEHRYRVSAVGGLSGLPFQEECFSNTVVTSQRPDVYIPNSFVPESDIAENRIFKPVNMYADAMDYTLTVFDRWGQVVFETHRPDEGWDGTIRGGAARMGVYVYQMTYRLDGKKKLFSRRGMVNLIR
jgi:gliding motility-associated-like protein